MRKRLYRSRTDRMLAGVAAGMAQWLDLDPSVVRIVWALLVLAGGAGILLYIVAAIVIPEEPVAGMADGGTATEAPGEPGTAPAANVMSTSAPVTRHEGNGAIVFGAILLLVGAWLLIRQYVPNLDDRFVWPSVLVVIGLLLIAAAMRRR